MLEKRFRQLKPNVSVRTIMTYSANIRRLRKIDKDLNYQAISSYLKTLPPMQAVNLLTSVVVFEGKERYGDLYKTLCKLAEEQRYSQKFSKAELDNWTTVSKFREGIRRCKFDVDRLQLLTVKKRRPTHLQILVGYILLKFYNEFHWRSDIVSVRIGKHTGNNYYHAGQFYLNSFKTSKKFKQRGLLPMIYTPSQSLSKLIRKFIEVRNAQNMKHDYFLWNVNMNPMSRDGFYAYMCRLTFKYVGVRLSSNMLRHIYATEFLAGDPTLQEKQNILRGMMQLSLSTFESYGRRNENGKLAAKP